MSETRRVWADAHGDRPGLEPGCSTRLLERGDAVILANVDNGNWVRLSRADYDAVSAATGPGSDGHAPGGPGLSSLLVESGLMRRRSNGIGAHRGRCRSGEDAYGDGLFLPKRVYLNVTGQCNLSCPHCYFSRDGCAGGELRTEDWLRVLGSIPKVGAPEIVFSGGEPLLRTDLPVLIAAAARRGLALRLLTNGTLMTRDMALLLASEGVCVQVSLESGRPAVHDGIRGNGTFEAAVGAVVMLREAGCPSVELVTTLSRYTRPDLLSVAELAQRLGVLYHFSLFMPVGRGRCGCADAQLQPPELCRVMAELIEYSLAQATEHVGLGALGDTNHRRVERCPSPDAGRFPVQVRAKASCGAGLRVVSIAPDGSIYPCPLMHGAGQRLGRGTDIEELFVQGLSATGGGHGAGEGLRANTLPARVVPGVDDQEPCRACDVRYLCGGGCRARGWDERSGRAMPATDGYCGFFKAFLGECVWNWDEVLGVESNLRRLAASLRRVAEEGSGGG